MSTSTAPPRNNPSNLPPTLLTLPLEIRLLIYRHTLPPLIILPSTILYPVGNPANKHRPLSKTNTFAHPSPLNPLVYGIANRSSRWRTPTHAYPPSARVRVLTTQYTPLPHPHPLQLTCKQVYHETTDYALKSGLWTFAFSRFGALVKWVKGRDGRRVKHGQFLARVTSVLVEMELDVLPRTQISRAASENQDPEPDVPIPEAQVPWLDALHLLLKHCPNLHTFGLHLSLSGPEIQVIHFGALPQPPPPTPASSSSAFPLSSPGNPASTSPYAANPPPQDWPPGQAQPRADFKPVIEKILEYVEGLRGLKRCAVTVRAGHVLRNLGADPGDGSLWARAWAEEEMVGDEYGEVGRRVKAVERGLERMGEDGDGIGDGRGKGVMTDVAEARRRMLARRGMDMLHY